MRKRLGILAVCLIVFLIGLTGVVLAEFSLGARSAHKPQVSAEDLKIQTPDGLTLVASLRRASSKRCLIILHGVAANREHMQNMSRGFAALGYHVLTPDSRGHGSSSPAAVTYGLREKHDLHQWVDLMARTQPCSEGIFAIGVSMGAAVVLQALPETPLIRASVAESSFVSFERIGRDRVTQIVPPLSWLRVPIVATGLTYIQLTRGFNLHDASPLAAADQIQVPVLLIHGTADTNIVPEHSELLLPHLKQGQILRVPGGQHAGCYGRDTAAYQKAADALFRAAIR